MEREQLKQILLLYYSDSSSNHILRGIRKPSYEVMVELYHKHNIPFDSWLNIKSYLNDTKQQDHKSTTKEDERVAS